MNQKVIQERWQTGKFLEVGHEAPSADYPGFYWVPYESYMKALLVSAVQGQLGRLIVEFPPEAAEDNQLHIHPISDRIITVISGSGEFIAVRNRRMERFVLEAGHKVWMPRGVLHTFVAGKQGLVVESLHNPFVPFDDPKCLVYPNKGE